ncbi:MAG TPA: hypothetical protein VGH91_04995 [Gammaproteobacteria bacterium]
MSVSRATFAFAMVLVLSAPAAWAYMADPAAGSDAETMYLGKIEVKGQKNIVRTLQAIKIALSRPISVDPADAQAIVCRIEKPLGEVSEYLECATNEDYTKQRDAIHRSMESTFGSPLQCTGRCSEDNWLQHLVAKQADSRIHMRVDGPAFRKLIRGIPVPADTTVVAPASASQEDKD